MLLCLHLLPNARLLSVFSLVHCRRVSYGCQCWLAAVVLICKSKKGSNRRQHHQVALQTLGRHVEPDQEVRRCTLQSDARPSFACVPGWPSIVSRGFAASNLCNGSDDRAAADVDAAAVGMVFFRMRGREKGTADLPRTVMPPTHPCDPPFFRPAL